MALNRLQAFITTNQDTDRCLLSHLPQCQLIGSSLVQVMACRLFGAKPLPEPMLAFHQLDSRKQISVKFESEFCHFHSRKFIWKCRLPKWRPCSGGRWANMTAVLVLHRDLMATILQTTVRDAFSCVKIVAFWLKFHWSLLTRIQLTISQ